MAKRQKQLQEICGLGGVSDRSLARILLVVANNPDVIEEPAHHASVSKAARKVLDEIGTDEHTFVLRDGTELKWKHVSLQSLLPFLCRRCPWFKQLLANVLRAHASPWHLITYNDDFTPGAALRIQNKRKGSIWEVSIGEFGAYLCHAELWFPIGIMRTKLVHQIPGKYSAITKVLL